MFAGRAESWNIRDRHMMETLEALLMTRSYARKRLSEQWLVVAAGWRRLPRYEGPSVRLLLLRSFTLGERSNRLFQDLESLWRSIGSIQLVGAVDLALTTLEPHELLDFMRGRSGREFVHCPADVDARLASFDQTRDPDGRFA
jgi:hypothetical protein